MLYCLRIEFTQLAVTTKSLNLGQGFPDYDPPSRFTDFLAQVATEKNSFFNQYTRGFVITNMIIRGCARKRLGESQSCDFSVEQTQNLTENAHFVPCDSAPRRGITKNRAKHEKKKKKS